LDESPFLWCLVRAVVTRPANQSASCVSQQRKAGIVAICVQPGQSNARHRPFAAHGWPLWFTVQGDGTVKNHVSRTRSLIHDWQRAF
jgi:hypothetical protein